MQGRGYRGEGLGGAAGWNAHDGATQTGVSAVRVEQLRSSQAGRDAGRRVRMEEKEGRKGQADEEERVKSVDA